MTYFERCRKYWFLVPVALFVTCPFLILVLIYGIGVVALWLLWGLLVYFLGGVEDDSLL